MSAVERRHPPNRRGSVTFNFECSGLRYTATCSFFDASAGRGWDGINESA